MSHDRNHEVGESYSHEKDRYGVNHDSGRVEPMDSDREADNQRRAGVQGRHRFFG